MIDISYIEDEVEQPDEEHVEAPSPAAPRPRWHRWAAFGAIVAAVLCLFAVASSRTQPPDRLKSADGVGVGQVYTVSQRFGQSWVRVTEITLTAATPNGDPAALFIVEGRGWYPHQAGRLAAQACDTGQSTDVGSWTAGDDGWFRFADTDPAGGAYLLTITGLASDPIRIVIGPGAQRVLMPLEQGCPNLA